MRHTEPGSASVVSRVTFGKMETIDRMRLIHCGRTPGFGCGRIREAVGRTRDPSPCGFVFPLKTVYRCSMLGGGGGGGWDPTIRRGLSGSVGAGLTGFTGNRLRGRFRAGTEQASVCR